MNRGECCKRRGSALLIILMVILTIVCTPLPSFLPSAHAPPVPGSPRSIAKAGDLNGVPYRNIVYAKGYCFVFYRGTNGYLMYRSSSDGVVWSSETNASHVKLSNDTDNNPRHDYAAFVTRSGDIWIAYCNGRYANLWGPPTYYSTAYTRIGAANDGKASWSTQNSLGTSQGWWGFCFAHSVSGDIYLATTRYTGIWSYVGVYYWIDPYGWSLLDGSSRPVGTPPAAIALTWLPNSYAGKGVVFVMAQHRMGIFQYNCWGAGGKPGWMFGWYNLGYFGKITGLSVRESISLVTANNKVHFAYVPNEGGDANSKLYYAYMKDDGSGWNAETTLDDLGYCSSPSLTVDSSNLYALYLSEYDGVKRVLYRTMDYSSYLWSGENTLASGEDNPKHLASTLNSTDISGVITFGVNWWASPDNVRFANLKVGIQVTVSVGRSSIEQGETQTWTASGLPVGAGYIATVRCPSTAIIVGTGTADGSGQASGSFLVGTNIPTGTVSFRVELAADDKIYGETTFTIANYVLVHSGRYWDWYAYQTTWDRYSAHYLSQIEYPDQVYETLRDILGVDVIQDTPDHRLYLLVDERTEGGFSTSWIDVIGKGPGIGVFFDAWFEKCAGQDYWSHEYIAHETTNVFTGQIVSGWPSDWWADTLSPFPYAIKIKVEQATGHQDAAQKSLNTADDLVRMFLGFMSSYGDDIYAKMLRAIKGDGWTQWFGPNPSQLLSEYVAAYLSIAANTNLADQVNAAFQLVGANRPTTYLLDADDVGDIMRARQILQSIPKDDSRWAAFRNGDYQAVLVMQPIPQEILDAEGELYRAARNAADEIANEVANMLGTVGGDLAGIVFRDVLARLVAFPIKGEEANEAMQEIAQIFLEIPGKLGEEYVRKKIADGLVNLVGVPFVEEIDTWHEEFVKSTVFIHPGVDLSKIAEDMRTLATILQGIQENLHKDYRSKFYQIEEWKSTIKDIKYTWGTFGRNQFLMAYVFRPGLTHVIFEMQSAVTTPLLISQEILDLGQAISFTWTYGYTKEQEFRIVKMYTRELVKVQSAIETGSLQATSAELISISIPSDITLNSIGNFGGEIKNTGEYGFDARLVIEIRDPAGNVRGPFYTPTITVPFGATGFAATDIPFVNSPSWIDVDESGTYKATIYAEYGMLEFERRTAAIEREFVVIDPPFGFDKKIELGPKIKSSMVTFMISVTNPSDSDATVSVTDTIPKELVTSIDDIEFVTPPDDVIEDDQVVKWLIRIQTEGCADIVYRIHSPLDPEGIKWMLIPAATLTSSFGPDQSSVINIGNEGASTQTVEILLMRLKGTISDLPASAFSGGEQQADHQRKMLSDRIEEVLATLHDGDIGGALISFVNLFSPTTDGEPSIEHWITDEDAQSLLLPIFHNTASFMKLIAHARTLAPIVEAGHDQMADEGDMVSLSGSFVGLGPSDAHAIKWDFGDGDGATGTLTPMHAYGDNGAYTIELTVTDDKGREGMDALTIEVSNVEPIVDAGSDQEVFAGDIVYFSGSFSDPGCLDTHTAIWDFGDGVMENGAINEVNNPPESTGTITGSHTYSEAQTYAIALIVTDDEGGVGSDTITIKVKPIPATVDIDPDTLNLKSNGKWITAYIELPERYDLNDIGLTTIKLWIGDDSFIAERKDVQNDILMVKFDRQVITDYLTKKYIEEGEVTMIVRGKVYNNGALADFECKDTTRVISKGKGK